MKKVHNTMLLDEVVRSLQEFSILVVTFYIIKVYINAINKLDILAEQ